MSSNQFANRLNDVTRNLNDAVRRVSKDLPPEPTRVHIARVESPAAEPVAMNRRAPAPPPSPLITARIRNFTQEETRLHWHHHDLPVSRFSACMMLPG